MNHSLRLFFDLDGTLTDSAEGITACIQHALASLNRRQPTADEIRPFIGSPLGAIFASFLSETTAEPDGTPLSALTTRAIDRYRERFDAKGFAENRVYPGVREGLDSLRADGHELYIATAKRPDDALRVARHFDLDGFFAGVFGAQSDAERNDKGMLLARALASSGASAARAIMIGDRCHDMSAAVSSGATPLGAGWGYGSERELREAGAHHIAAAPAEMVEWIGKRAVSPPPPTTPRAR